MYAGLRRPRAPPRLLVGHTPLVSRVIAVAAAGAAVKGLAFLSAWRSSAAGAGRCPGAAGPAGIVSPGLIAGQRRSLSIDHASAAGARDESALALGAARKAAKAAAKPKAKAKKKKEEEEEEESADAPEEEPVQEEAKPEAAAGQAAEPEEEYYRWDEEPEPQPPYGKAPGWKRNMTDEEWDTYYSKLRKWRYRRTGSEERWIWNPKSGVQWFIGDLVEVRRPDRGDKWSAGRVARNHGDSTFTVKWDEDGEQFRAPYAGMRKCRNPEDHPLPDWIETWWPTERDWDD